MELNNVTPRSKLIGVLHRSSLSALPQCLNTEASYYGAYEQLKKFMTERGIKHVTIVYPDDVDGNASCTLLHHKLDADPFLRTRAIVQTEGEVFFGRVDGLGTKTEDEMLIILGHEVDENVLEGLLEGWNTVAVIDTHKGTSYIEECKDKRVFIVFDSEISTTMLVHGLLFGQREESVTSIVAFLTEYHHRWLYGEQKFFKNADEARIFENMALGFAGAMSRDSPHSVNLRKAIWTSDELVQTDFYEAMEKIYFRYLHTVHEMSLIAAERSGTATFVVGDQIYRGRLAFWGDSSNPLAQALLRHADVSFAVVASLFPDNLVKLSFRSMSSRTPVDMIAKSLGGDGTRNVAEATVSVHKFAEIMS